MATLVFSLSTKVDKVSGLSEILTRFFVGSRINQRAKSNIFVDATYWNDQKQSIVIPNFRLNNDKQKQLVAELKEKSIKLNDLRTYIMDAFNENGAGMKELPKDWLKNIIKDFYGMPAKPMEDLKPVEIPIEPIIIKPVEKEVKAEPAKKVVKATPKPQLSQDSAPATVFFQVFSDFIAKNDISENRKRHYRVVYRALQRYEAYNKITLSFDNITAETLKDFERYLSNEHELFDDHKLKAVMRLYPESRPINQRGSNYVKDMMGKLRTFCRYASSKIKEMPINEPFFQTNPFDAYSIGTQTALGTPYFLTIEERNHLYHFDLNSERLSRQRDIFIFQCLDFDHLDDIHFVRRKLLDDDYFETQLLFTSPSGNGLKWIVEIDPSKASHLDYFLGIQNYLKLEYGLEIDPSGKDICRACFLPHDPQCYINPKLL